MERVQEFSQDGKIFVSIDFSGLSADEDFFKVIELAVPMIAKHPEKSVYTITNIDNLRFDTHTKEIAVNFMEQNKPYVKCGVITGLDGIKKMMARTVMMKSGRTNMYFTFSEEQAIEWLLRQE